MVTMGILLPQQAAAVVYKYLGPEGVIHYTNHPIKKQGFRLLWRSAAYEAKTLRVNAKAFQQNRKRFGPLIEAAAKRWQLRPELLHAVVRVESFYDPDATSRTGAVGLMQLMPETARRYGVTDRRDPAENLEGGARYLRELLEMFRYDLKLALAAYNAGENAVRQYGNRIPPYPETQNYVRKVLDYYQNVGRGDS
ncbi:MAG TPA: DUF4124 domain-containing protein [Chromatiales bacterium]|nr:DUF4124 domain-containing protein [Chromatiales bacterium]